MAIKIYIDQGHNPQNPNAGAEGNGLREQDITYRVGKELGNLLRGNPEFEVRESRPTPETSLGTSNASSLRARVTDANSWGADAFISLHTNASELPEAGGTEAFAYRRESRAFELGEDILAGISAETGLANRGMQVRPGLYVLRRTAMPAVLVELGFLTNPKEAELMNRDPQLFAIGVYQGIMKFYGFEKG